MELDFTTIMAILMAVFVAARGLLIVIAPLTETKKDDKLLAFVKKVISVLSLHVK